MITGAKRIAIKIDPLGNPTVTPTGFVGRTCFDATKPYEAAFAGGKMNVEEAPAAMMAENTGHIEQHITNG